MPAKLASDTMSSKQPKKKVKKLKVKEVAAVAKAISAPKQDLAAENVS